MNKCACDLLFPFVAATGGYDTGIAIANTSLDNLGTGGISAATQQFGGVQFWYYGTGNNGGTRLRRRSAPTLPVRALARRRLHGDHLVGQSRLARS